MPAKRVLISIDERLLARIDDACARRGLTRSGYLAQLADADLVGRRGPGTDPAVRHALAALDALLGDVRP
jgi:metal-responsive CopG/Arc/MetJ family transcriptional regulator